MSKISRAGYRFPPEIIHQAIWFYLRFTLSFRDVEDLLAERGIALSYETVRRWVNHFGKMIAADLRRRRPKPCTTWHLDEIYLKIAGRMVSLWRAVDVEDEVLDVLVQSKQNKRAALKLMRKLLKKCGFVPARLISDQLALIWRRRPRSWDRASPRTRAMEEQPCREFAPAYPAARAHDATVPEPGLSPEVSLNPCRRLQRLQCPTPPHFCPDASHFPRRGDGHLTRGSFSRLKLRGLQAFPFSVWQRDKTV
jgi:transposase-like protein